MMALPHSSKRERAMAPSVLSPMHNGLKFQLCLSAHLSLGMGDYENMSQRLLFLRVSRLLRLLATLHMYVDFIQQSN